jgi:serine/threonine protein kinase
MTTLPMPANFDPSTWIEPGDVILDKYVVSGPLAEGRIGAVLKAKNSGGVDLAVKTIRLAIRTTSTADQLARLMGVMRREAELQSGFCHPNIIGIVESGFDTRLGVCTVMECAPLGTLRTRIRERTLDLASALDIVDALLDALTALHAPSPAHPHGVVHLDLEPKNIVFGADHSPKICDFHYARRVSPQPVPSEWIDAAHPIEIRTDLRQVGCLFREMVSGQAGSAPGLLPTEIESYVRRLAADVAHGGFPSAAEARRALGRRQ